MISYKDPVLTLRGGFLHAEGVSVGNPRKQSKRKIKKREKVIDFLQTFMILLCQRTESLKANHHENVFAKSMTQ